MRGVPKKASAARLQQVKAPRVDGHHAHCKALWDWRTLQMNNIRELGALIHVPNEGKRTPQAAARMKAEGMVPGVWDYVLPIARVFQGAIRSGLIIEIKYGKDKLSPEQQAWGDMMMGLGHMSIVAYDWEDAKGAILDYLGAFGAERTAN